LADDDLEAGVGACGDREVTGRVAGGVEDRDPGGDGFAVGGEAETVGFDVGLTTAATSRSSMPAVLRVSMIEMTSGA
jgi:hypothetical protein